MEIKIKNISIPIIEEKPDKTYKISRYVQTTGIEGKEYKQENLQYEAPHENYSDAEWIKIFPEAIPYLKRKLKSLKRQEKYLQTGIRNDLTKLYKNNFNDDFSQTFGEELIGIFKFEELEDLQKQIIKLSLLLNPPREVKGRITQEQIQRAKDYPFENLIRFNRAGFTKCFAHEEKTPSLHFQKEKNKLHCFGCGKNWDTISYLREVRGLSFKDAVKQLQ